MKGFDTKFSDFPDYILGITKRFGKIVASPLWIVITQRILSFGLPHLSW